MAGKNKGRIVQIISAVIDVRLKMNYRLYIAVEIELDGEKIVLEVMQHLGDHTVRCISMHPTEGLRRGMEAVDTGAPISVPVGEEILGRMVNVLGDPIDNLPAVETKERWPIHRDPPRLVEQLAQPEILETGIKAESALSFCKGGKIGLFGGAGEKTVLIMELKQYRQEYGGYSVFGRRTYP